MTILLGILRSHLLQVQLSSETITRVPKQLIHINHDNYNLFSSMLCTLELPISISAIKH